MTCIFCRIVDGSIPSQRIYEDAATLAFMDINPGTRGHALVIPKRHAADLFEIDPEELQRVILTTQRVAQAAQRVLGCAGINIVQSNGAAAFQSVFHLHMHVIPRYPSDDVRLPWIPKQGQETVVAESTRLLRQALQSTSG